MRISIGPFRARIPRSDDRLLPEQNATVAKGCDLRSGAIRPFRKSALSEAIGAGFGSIYRWYQSSGTPLWLRFPGNVDVVGGPVADDVWERIYWTGDPRFDEPRMSYTGPIQAGGSDHPNNSFKLGVPPPENQLDVEPIVPGPVTIADIHRERPIRVVTSAPHNLETGELVEFNIEAEASTEENNDLALFLRDREFQVRVTGETEFTLEQTDAANIAYSAFVSGTVQQVFPPGFLSTRFYTHTYVTNLGEEGPPAPSSGSVEMGLTQKASLTLPLLDPGAGQGRIIERRRIYRTATGNQGAQFQFVADLPVEQVEYTDEVSTAQLGSSLESTEWDPPPETLKGLRLAAQGFGVGFYDNVVAASEPNQLHAWPTTYQNPLDYQVVAIEVIDNGVVVGTTGQPYLLQGIDPRALTPRKLEDSYACVSARSMVSMGYAAIYATTEGLVMIGGGRAQLVTRQLVTERDWTEFFPHTINACEHQGRYIGFYDGGPGARRGFMFDPQQPDAGIVDLDFYAVDTFRDSRDGFLYLLDDSGDILRWDDPDSDPEPYRWRSKTFIANSPSNLAAAKVAISSGDAEFRVYADGQLVHEEEISSPDIFRLPAGYLAREFVFEIEGDAHIHDAHVSDSALELEP